MKEKILNYGIVILSLVLAAVFYMNFDLEGILWSRYDAPVVSSSQIEESRATDYTGMKAGNGILNMTTGEEWDGLFNEVGYATAVPVSIIKTDVYSLGKWESYYTQRRNGSSGRRRSEVIRTFIDYSGDYSPYYIIELQDGTHILAQMNRGIADQIAKGERVELPLGRKIGFSDTARNMLSKICKEYDVSTKYVFYTINDTWQAEHDTGIFLGKFALSGVLFLVIAVALMLIKGKIFGDDETNSATA